MIIIIFFLALGVVTISLFKSKNQNDNSIIKNYIMNILTFILLFIVYYVVVAIISMILYMMSSNSNSGSDSGLWAYSIILGIVLAPILSLITTIKLNKKRKNTEITEQINDNNIIQRNKKNSIIIISIVIVSFIGIGTILFTILNLKAKQLSTSVLYNITYYDELIPGSKYEISVQDNGVEITKTSFCSAVDCNHTIEKETFNYSKENIEKLKSFINNNFSNNYNIELNDISLTERQREVIQGLLLGEYFFEANVEEYKYKIEYSKSDDLSYNIYFKNDKSILVKKLKINSDYDIVNVDTYSLNFSQKNKNILLDYIEKEVKKQNSNIIYKYSTLQKDEINIFNSLVENDEVYLNNIENEARLSYTISYNGINCPTPTLYLYSDNTYEYYYTFGTDNEKLIPKTGTYNYDIKKIISNIDNYEENSFGPYSIKEENGKSYTTYNTNNELQELLSSLNITLEKCLEQQ